MSTFAEQLTAARKKAGMTQEELSEAVHVARNTISNWERGQRKPDLDTMRLLGQVLHTDFVNGDEPWLADENAKPEPSAEESENHEITQAVETQPVRNKINRKAVIAVILAAVVLCAAFLIGLMLGNKPAASVKDKNGTRYTIADYDKTTPNEAGKAYLSIVKTLTVRPGDGKDYYGINFTAREDNGIAFRIDRLEMVVFFADKADVFVFSHDELASLGYEPDMPAYGFVSFDNGFPTDQAGLQGMSIKIMGKDANNADLTFTSYLPIP